MHALRRRISYLRLFGSPDLTASDGQRCLSILSQPKRLALLAYLAIARPRGAHSRDKVFGLLWPESDLDHARNSLRQSLHFLRRGLGPEVFVSRGEGGVAVAEESLQCDVVEFEAALEANNHAGALELYRADLLEGFFIPEVGPFEQWLEAERTRLRGQAVSAAVYLSERAVERSEDQAALRWARRAVDLDSTDESCVRNLIEVHATLGDGAGAVRVYQDFVHRLAHEYALEPSPETTAAVDAVRTRARATEDPPTRETPPLAPEPVPPRSVAPQPRVVRQTRQGSWRRIGVVQSLVGLGLAIAVLMGAWASSFLPLISWNPPSAVGSVAVLPFRSIGPGDADLFFADAMHQEILTQLSNVRTLRVIARTSVVGYSLDMEDDRTVAEALGVGYLIRGAVQITGDRIRIWARLIDGTNGEQLWASSVEADRDDLYSLQLEVAGQIAIALQVRFPDTRLAQGMPRPTEIPAAYDSYVRGRLHASRMVNLDDARDAVRDLQEAVRLDPGFSAAYAALSSAMLIRAYAFDEPDQMEGAEDALRRAVALAPDDVRTWLAEAYHFSYGAQDYDRALARLEQILEVRPSDAEALALKGFVERRMGRWEAAAATMTSALEVDPNSYTTTVVLAEMLMRMRQFASAESLLDRAIAISPGGELAYVEKALLQLNGRGDTAAARITLEAAPSTLSPKNRSLPALIALYRRDYDGALRLLLKPSDTGVNARSADELILLGLIHLRQGDRQLAADCGDSIQRLFVEGRRPAAIATATGRSWPLAVWGSHAAVVAVLSGRSGEAVAEAERAVALFPLSKDAYAGAEILERLAEVYAIAGRTDQAIETLDRLLSVPSRITPHVLLLHPVYQSLGGDPAFLALLARQGRTAPTLADATKQEQGRVRPDPGI